MCAPRPFKVKDWALTCGRFAITLPRMRFSIRSRCVVHYLCNSLVLQMHATLMIQTRGPASDTYMVISNATLELKLRESSCLVAFCDVLESARLDPPDRHPELAASHIGKSVALELIHNANSCAAHADSISG